MTKIEIRGQQNCLGDLCWGHTRFYRNTHDDPKERQHLRRLSTIFQTRERGALEGKF